MADDVILRSVTTTCCKHLVVDAGHISITSELASKEALRQIQAKRKKQYTDADYKHLESMMYDRLKVQLEAAQVRRNLLEHPTRCNFDALYVVPHWGRSRLLPQGPPV